MRSLSRRSSRATLGSAIEQAPVRGGRFRGASAVPGRSRLQLRRCREEGPQVPQKIARTTITGPVVTVSPAQKGVAPSNRDPAPTRADRSTGIPPPGSVHRESTCGRAPRSRGPAPDPFSGLPPGGFRTFVGFEASSSRSGGPQANPRPTRLSDTPLRTPSTGAQLIPASSNTGACRPIGRRGEHSGAQTVDSWSQS